MSRIFQRQRQSRQDDSPREKKRRLDIMLEITLPTSYSHQIWQSISSVQPLQFLRSQQDIKNILLTDDRLFQSFFPRFYNNHQNLSNWYMLANSNRLEIKKYIFHQLLSKPYKEYKQLIREMFPSETYTKSVNHPRSPDLLRENTIRQKKKQSFHKIYVSNKADPSPERPEKSVRDRQIRAEAKENNCADLQKQDYHDLFLRTFGACDGSKYIYYDFNRHMKGAQEKKKYNQFIRIKRHKVCRSNIGDLDQLRGINEKQVQDVLKSANISLYSKSPAVFYHEGEDLFEDTKYSNFTLDPIGQIQKSKFVRDLMWLRKTAGGLKKVKSQQTPFRFQLKRKRIL